MMSWPCSFPSETAGGKHGKDKRSEDVFAAVRAPIAGFAQPNGAKQGTEDDQGEHVAKVLQASGVGRAGGGTGQLHGGLRELAFDGFDDVHATAEGFARR